jgi:hypothetical protein
MTTTSIDNYTQIRPALKNTSRIVFVGSNGKVTIERDLSDRLHCFVANNHHKPMDYKIYRGKPAITYATKWARKWMIKFK